MLLLRLILIINSLNLILCDYCVLEKDLCDRGKRHIGCYPDQIPKGVCFNSELLKINKKTILKIHNDVRDKTAAGFMPNLPNACKMNEVLWDSELEKLAKIHVKQCKMIHDECRSTDIHRHAGQNIAYYSYSKPLNDTNFIINQALNLWIGESTTTNPALIKKFTSKLNKNNGHFTLMVRDKVRFIGCACLKYEEKKTRTMYSYLVTCNYSDTNMKNEPVYKSGIPTSKCSDHKLTPSKNYKNLCN